jgi:F-type H+-transporting ATPase subunit delta
LTAQIQTDDFLKVVGDQLSGNARKFVTELVQNKRLEALPEIAALFEDFRAELEQSAEVSVTTAYALDDAQRQTLVSQLGRKLGRKVAIGSVTVDKTLIGGVVVRSGDIVIDASVRGKLGKLSATLNS